MGEIEVRPARLSCRSLSKCYSKTTVLENVSASFSQGEIHGLVGRNGSGKTVLLRCFAGLSRPTNGEIFANGDSVEPWRSPLSGLGAIIEVPNFIGSYSGFRNLKYLAAIKGRTTKEAILAAMSTVGLDPENRKPVRKYSLGMRQRLGIAQAFMEGQDLLLLDEPFNGLDDAGLEEMRNLLLRLKRGGKTIVLASHSSEDINLLCDDVFRISSGRIERVS